MSRKIEVKCLNDFKVYKRNILYAEVFENEVYTAILNEESGEYFAKDDRGHEFLVGELDFNDILQLDGDFELIG